ncbi:MAG TPA: N-acetylglucosamine kinase [Flavipsychrobacter sp.]|jgi:N-acetylglucosamine kinase-like BadF-type ATPase|nr:N-acetylglucosamine kinase [Flavipsychrobacter sp.]
MSNILIAESGATKTDWRLLDATKKIKSFSTTGINPYLQTPEMILAVLENELGWDAKKHQADKVFYYGTGVSNSEQQKKIGKVLTHFFQTKSVTVNHDMLAAARAACGNNKGVVSILGTGSNSCYFDGKQIKVQQRSLGYIAGDEGSGNYLGKRVLQYYAYKTFDDELTMSFEKLFGDDFNAIVKKLYAETFPNRYLAEFVLFLRENRGHFMVENIIEDCLNDFFNAHILKYRQSWKSPIHFVGSIAFEFRTTLKMLCEQYELELGNIIKSPIEQLIGYHKE